MENTASEPLRQNLIKFPATPGVTADVITQRELVKERLMALELQDDAEALAAKQKTHEECRACIQQRLENHASVESGPHSAKLVLKARKGYPVAAYNVEPKEKLELEIR